MTRTRIAALTLAAVALVGGTTWAVTTETEPAEFGAATEVAAQQTLPVVPSLSPAPVAEKKAPAKPAAATTAPAKPGRHATPAPFVQTFAAQPGATRQKAKRKPTAPVKVAPTVDGCDRNYGTVAHCIPIRFPAGVTDKCVWLRDHGYRNVKVAAKDRQGLDPDRNGIICDK
ncbi:hypothetical protein Q0Z83_067730 [Actinoplanes sichuanensis]|uniref:Excalibur calcium-binding domain-containing protein n=1 Tax=Actinoplanes sichuanensis TaxID=512349 RepID=A0ABW4AB66_9ACTN|nr:hypothetical protein [Actinoplanes sichuanensis]BEL08582.1 hypothetical protein Q0Z83_067730 [Actinoplanes sichuanensis]